MSKFLEAQGYISHTYVPEFTARFKDYSFRAMSANCWYDAEIPGRQILLKIQGRSCGCGHYPYVLIPVKTVEQWKAMEGNASLFYISFFDNALFWHALDRRTEYPRWDKDESMYVLRMGACRSENALRDLLAPGTS